MWNEIIDKINLNKEVLSTLPKNNKKNISNYKNRLEELLVEYKGYSAILHDEVMNRFHKISMILPNNRMKELEDEINAFEANMNLISDYNSSYEKVGLDRVIYDIGKYYKTNLDSVNKKIREAIDIFNKVGIKLSSNSFNYSCYANMYMDAFFKEINKEESSVLKEVFENIYWKCSDILVHIELTFKYLYYKYKKQFDRYCVNYEKDFLGKKTEKGAILDYLEWKREYIDLCNSDLFLILNKFKNKELSPAMFSDNMIEGYKKELSSSSLLKEDVSKLYYSVLEYKNYLSISYVIDYGIKLYDSSSYNKNDSKKYYKEIRKIEKKLFSLNDKINKLRYQNKDFGKYSLEVDKLILKLKDLYDSYQFAVFQDRLHKYIFVDSTYFDMLSFINDHYVYLVRCIKEANDNITDLEVLEKVEELRNVLRSPNNKFLNNMVIHNDKDIKMVIGNCYKLSNFNVSADTFESDSNVSHLEVILYRFLVYLSLMENGISFEYLKFICDVWEMKFS